MPKLSSSRVRRAVERLKMKLLERRIRRCRRHEPGRASCQGLTVNFVDALSYYMEFKDIFVHRIYDFETRSARPFIVDGGSYIGMSVLYFKLRYPDARILAFEPDPVIAEVLRSNISDNGLLDVEVVEAGLSDRSERAGFAADGADGGRIADSGSDGLTIRTVKLSEYVSGPVDFLKLNVEGCEKAVIDELAAAGRLDRVDQMVVEYHGWPQGPQDLGSMLSTLDASGFRYMLHDFDHVTNAVSKPPFRLSREHPWFSLVYARNLRHA